jgi:DNA-binding MarR family transcriptional regulator
MARRRPNQREKTVRAFRAYVDLVDTADWMRLKLRGQLETFDLTMQGFRLLEMMYREGHINLAEAAKELGCTRQNMEPLVGRLEERGWVKREIVRLKPGGTPETRLMKSRRGENRKGARSAIERLTPLGEKLMRVVLPKHIKVVKAFMRALDAREKDSLSRICRKLREGDVVGFWTEMRYLDREERESEIAEAAN